MKSGTKILIFSLILAADLVFFYLLNTRHLRGFVQALPGELLFFILLGGLLVAIVFGFLLFHVLIEEVRKSFRF